MWRSHKMEVRDDLDINGSYVTCNQGRAIWSFICSWSWPMKSPMDARTVIREDICLIYWYCCWYHGYPGKINAFKKPMNILRNRDIYMTLRIGSQDLSIHCNGKIKVYSFITLVTLVHMLLIFQQQNFAANLWRCSISEKNQNINFDKYTIDTVSGKKFGPMIHLVILSI